MSNLIEEIFEAVLLVVGPVLPEVYFDAYIWLFITEMFR